MKRYCLSLLLLMATIALLAAPAPVMAEKPLTQNGKQSVFQRVVSNPGAQLYASSDAGGQVIATPKVFTSYYVYERAGDMLRVGVSATQSDGWLKASEATEWAQAITMVFTDRMGRQPVLFFRDHNSIEKVCQADNIGSELDQWITLFSQKARVPDDCPVVAMEPSDEEGSVSNRNFYLMPVLNLDLQYKDSGVKLLEVACVDPGNWNEGQEEKPKAKKVNTKNLKTGIAFVIDTTISMKPYIDKTTELVRRIYDELEKSPARDNYGMAVVAFRSNMEKSPGIEYTTKVISDFKKVRDRSALENLLKQVDEAKVSTHSFDEDALAGVMTAIQDLSWDEYNSRIIMLVTDAGPLGAGDPTSQTGMSPADIADKLRDNSIYLAALHVKSPSGKKDHRYAEESYVTLAKLQDKRDAYIPIDASTLKNGTAEFNEAAESLASYFEEFVSNKLDNNTFNVGAPSGSYAKKTGKESPKAKAQRIAGAMGYAMQLQFVGDELETSAPKVVKAWMSDADLSLLEKNPDDATVPSVYPAVLLTKAQLSQLRSQIKLIIETAEKGMFEDSQDFNFYEQLISAAAQMSRDPSQFSKAPKANLAQSGALLEVLDGLPYNSDVLNLQQEDWINKTTGEKMEFINRLKGLIKRYDDYDQDGRQWESFGIKNSSEWVYRVPLTSLP